MQNKSIILIIGMILVTGLAIGADGYINQEQLDAINISTINSQTLACAVYDVDLDDPEQPCDHVFGGQDYLCEYQGELRTYYTCLELEKINNDTYRYHNESVYHTSVPYAEIYKLYLEHNYTYAESAYWDSAIPQGLEYIDMVKMFILKHQTHDDDFWAGFEGGMW